MFEEREKRPELFSAVNIALAIVVHIVFFGVCGLVAAVSFAPKETVIPMDLTLVIHENLDGNDDEPPPTEKPQPQPPKPKPPEPKIETPPPKPPDKPVDAVVKVKDEKKAEKPKEEKKPEPPKKSAKELREERMRKMLESSTVVKPKNEQPPKPVTNGRTGRKTLSDAEIQKLLMQGYKAGRTEQIADSEVQRCVSLIYQAFYSKWESPAYSSSLREMILTVHFDMNGRVVNWNLRQSSGDAAADATVKRAAQLVKQVYGLSDSFLRENKTVDVRFKVKPQ